MISESDRRMGVHRWLCLVAAALLLVGGCDRRPRSLGNTPLHQAARSGNLGEVQTLIARGANLNAGEGNYRTPLHEAAAGGHKEIVEVLVRCGARVDSADYASATPIMAAVEHDHRPVVEYLISAGAAVNLQIAAYLGDVAQTRSLLEDGAPGRAMDREAWMALHYAVYYDHHEVARLLIAAGVDLNATTKHRIYMGRSDDVSGTALHYAVRRDDRDMIELLIDGGAGLEVRDSDGATPLCLAAERGRLDLVRLLLARGANPNGRIEENQYSSGLPLEVALRQGHIDIAEVLLSAGADASARGSGEGTPLHAAVTSQCVQAVAEALRQNYADPNEAGDEERGMFARQVCDALVPRMVELLVARGADVNVKDEAGVTPLHDAAARGRKTVVRLLLAKGAEVNAKTLKEYWGGNVQRTGLSPAGTTPLHEAAAAGDVDVVELLLAHGAQLDARDEFGGTPLHWAVESVSSGVVAHLIARGAYVEARDNGGATPLVRALLGGQVKTAKALIAGGAKTVDVKEHPITTYWDGTQAKAVFLHKVLDVRPWTWLGRYSSEVTDPNGGAARREWIELLLANGADPNERDDKGNTPLHAAVLAGNEELARLFVAHGTDVDARNASNLTALHYAARDGRAELAALLLAQGADVDARDNDGDTPLHNAALRGRRQVVEVLVAHGADLSVKNSRNRTPADEAARRGHKEIVPLLTASARAPSAGVPNDGTNE
jgi:ankyrin repeat protein